MKPLFAAILLAVSVAVVGGAQQQQKPPADEVAKLRQQITEIRRATDWDDEKAAEKANQQILALTKKLMNLQAGVKPTDAPPGDTGSGASAPAAPIDVLRGPDETPEREIPPPTTQMAYEVLKAATEAGQNEWADARLADNLREAIVKEYEEDSKPDIKNQAYFQLVDTLVIDFSNRYSTALLPQLPKFTAIKTLVLTGGRAGAPVNLRDVLSKAAKLPLERLYIINFRNFVGQLPDSVGQFPKLKDLGLFNNSLAALPSSIAALSSLEKLYIDVNPITTVLPVVQKLAALTELGVGKTQISAAERQQIQKLLPRCNILTK